MSFFVKEDISWDKNDLNRPLTKYQNYEIKGVLIDILIGNKNICLDKNICYYNIYTADSKKRIGVFEFPLDELSSHVDEQGDVIPPNNPKLYSFVNANFLQSAKKSQQQNQQEIKLKQFIQLRHSIKKEKRDKKETKEKKAESKKKRPFLENDENRIHYKKNDSIKKELYESISISRSLLPTETKSDAKNAIQEYNKQMKSGHVGMHWLNATMKSLHYTVQPASNFWSILERAIEMVGKKTSIEKCVSFLANHSNIESLFHEEKIMYSELEMLKYEQDRRAFTITSRLNDITKLFKPFSKYVLSKEDSERLKEEKSQLEKELLYIEQDLKDLREDIENRFSYMKHVKTLDDYKEYIQSSHFKVNEWAIQVMEHEFNLKCIWFINSTQKDSELNKLFTLPLMPNQKKMRPDVYLLLGIETPDIPDSTLYFEKILWICYKNHCVFSFQELPYSVKCLASQRIKTTPFYQLPDFQVLTGCRIFPENDITGGYYEHDVRFPIYMRSVPPKIPPTKWVYFRKLRKIKDWYKILSDDCMIQGGFNLDNHVWPSVTHYVLAGHFVDHSVYYLEFTDDGGGDSLISKSAEIAREAAHHTGVYRLKNPKKHSLELSNIEYLPNTFILKQSNVDLLSRRGKALRIKFENVDMRKVLLATLDAILLDEKGDEDSLLMQIRQEIKSVGTN